MLAIADMLAAPLEALGLERARAIGLHSAIQALVLGWSGLSTVFGPPLEARISVEHTVRASLKALICGWEQA